MFSYLSGADLYHKIALLNNRTRDSLPSSGLVDQLKKLTMKGMPVYIDNLAYALKLANVIELVTN